MSDIAGWGMGVSTDDNGEYICYGFPIDLKAENFSPDYEMCSKEEIEKHKADLSKRFRNKKRGLYSDHLDNIGCKNLPDKAWDIIFDYFTHE